MHQRTAVRFRPLSRVIWVPDEWPVLSASGEIRRDERSRSATGTRRHAWTLDLETQRLHLTWTEKGGPPVQAPTPRSFGTRLIETLGKAAQGRRTLKLHADWFRLRA